ncbi:hypothetical protein [Mycobacterium dioxanotrophicus]|uniref:hypothetical protein n=1 Tax=Mycobacterium dioxanotrophicus TaxID=482462 RepID=UPI0012FA0DAD|nr:hypothetical protein [Mycobacterium dioxanotrophicus]
MGLRTVCPANHTPPNLLDPPAAECTCPTVECPLRAEDICDEAEADEDYLYATTWADYHAKKPDSPRAEGTQCADSFGEVGGHESPSPERPPSDLLYEAALGLEWFVGLDGTRPPLERCQQLVAELRDLAAQFEADESESDRPVSQEDLAAHITAIRNAYVRATGSDASDDAIAASLLADYRVTK